MDQPAFLFGTYDAAASVTASGSATGVDPNDALEPTEDYYWTPDVFTSASIVIDTVYAETRDAWALCGRGLAAVTVEIRGSADDFVSSDVQIMAPTQIAAPVNAAWGTMTSGSYRYLKFLFTNMPSDFRLSHVWAGALTLLPWLETDWDPSSVDVDGDHLVSEGGTYLGAAQRKAMREFDLDWGQVDISDYATFAEWATECVATLRGFFFVPDTSRESSTATDECVHFGWGPTKFSAPYRNGMRNIKKIKFTTRAN